MTDDEYQLIIIFMESVEPFYKPFIKLNAAYSFDEEKKNEPELKTETAK